MGVTFRYTGHGVNGSEANGRINHDISFDAHLTIWDEGVYLPAISLGLRDFIGTGWYSSEYIVSTKSIGNLELTAGLGYGRLAGRHSFSNPLNALSSRFKERDANLVGKGGTLGTINWFQGNASAFYGIQYHISKKITLSSEYTPDIMRQESSYLNIKSPWNFGASFQYNDHVSFLCNTYTAVRYPLLPLSVNPSRPPFLGGKELAPVPMRLRDNISTAVNLNDEPVIRKVLAVNALNP